MRILFWSLAVLVFGGLAGFGYWFFHSDFKLFIALEAITALALILFAILYVMMVKPYHVLHSGMELLKEQDFSTRLRPVENQSANKVITIFNKMLDQLKEERMHVREQNHFLDLLVNASPQGLLILDFEEKITQLNPAAVHLLGIADPSAVVGRPISESGIHIAKALIALEPDTDIVVRSSGITLLRCTRSSFIDRGFPHPFILIEELTHELMVAEKKSYENVIRMMAHEVNNSIAAISSTLDVILNSLENDPDNELSDVIPSVSASFNRCDHLSRFISNFAQVVRIPPPHVSSVVLNNLIGSVEALSIPDCRKRSIQLALVQPKEPVAVQVDRIQMEQVLVNLVKNAYESIYFGGEIRIVLTASPCTITVEDNGPGISKDVEDDLFVPFFTTKSKGQGIGLMFVREVLVNHQFNFTFRTDPDGWTRFKIEVQKK